MSYPPRREHTQTTHSRAAYLITLVEQKFLALLLRINIGDFLDHVLTVLENLWEAEQLRHLLEDHAAVHGGNLLTLLVGLLLSHSLRDFATSLSGDRSAAIRGWQLVGRD